MTKSGPPFNWRKREQRVSLGQICIVTSHPYPESVGGEETFIKQYCRFLEANRIPFTVVSSSSKSEKKGLNPIYIRPFSIPFLGFEVYSLVWAFLAALSIVKVHSNHRIAAIHSVETGYGGLASAVAAGLLRLRLVVHSHTMRSVGLRNIRGSIGDLRTWPYWALERSIDKFVVGRASKLIAVSEQVASFVSSLGVSLTRIVVVPSALDLERYSVSAKIKLREQLGVRVDTFVIGYLGRLAPLKGAEVLLDAFVNLSEKSPRSAVVLIAGDGPLRNQLEAKVKEKMVKSVKFLGFYSDVPRFLESIDVLVFPSFLEGSPIVLLEAMAAGRPIVASDIQSVREVAGDSVMLFPPGDSGKLTEMLLELAANPQLRDQMAASSKKASLNFSTTKSMPKIFEADMDP